MRKRGDKGWWCRKGDATHVDLALAVVEEMRIW